MAMKGYSTFPKAIYISGHVILVGGTYASVEMQSAHFTASANWMVGW